MCCVFTILLFFGPRLAILIWWLINRIYIDAGVGGNWILEEIPVTVAAATHLVFAWTMLLVSHWGRFVPPTASTQGQAA